MNKFKKLTLYDDSTVYATNCTTLYTGCKGHSWINTGMTVQAKSLKKCLNCGETQLIK